MRHKTKRQLRNEILYLENDVDNLGLKLFLRDKTIDVLVGLLKVKDRKISRMTPEYRKSPYCATHESIAARQQVMGKNRSYVWMDYCNHLVREECDIA